MAKPAGGRDVPTLSELAASFRAKAMSALQVAPRDVPADDRIPLPELVDMFEASAKNGRCPNVEILSGFPDLQSTWWARRMIQVEQRLAMRSLEAQHALRCLADVETFLLPSVMAAKLMDQIPGHTATDRDLLTCFFQLIPQVAAAISRTPTGATDTAWYKPAEFVAAQAIIAWRLAGRKVIGTDDDSPLVLFVQAWLARANVHHASPAAIASVFTKGQVKQWKESLTFRGVKK